MSHLTKNVYWLASFPKSGNTWVRLFLEALFLGENFSINNTKQTDGIFSDITQFEIESELEMENLPSDLIKNYRIKAFENFVLAKKKNLFFKIHDAFVLSKETNESIIPISVSKKALYIVRNPLDILLSWSNHYDKSIEKSLEKNLLNKNTILAKNSNYSPQFEQVLLDWSGHAESWLSQKEIPVHCVRYEDMLKNPFETFSIIVRELDLEFSEEQIRKAIELTKFENLKKIESKEGFKENMNPKSTFFFKGESERWKQELTQEQIEKIRHAHEKMMKHFNYW